MFTSTHDGSFGGQRTVSERLGGKNQLLLPGFEPRFLYRPRRSWEDDIKMDLRETGRQDVENFIWRSTGTGEGIFCVCGNETSGSIKCGEFLD